MSTLSLRLPDSLHKALGELAHEDGVSMNQFITTAVAEKIATLRTIDYLKQRATHGNRKAFESVLAKVPDVPTIQGDELRAKQKQAPRKLPRSAGQRGGR